MENDKSLQLSGGGRGGAALSTDEIWDTYAFIGRRIRERRKELGLRQEDLAYMADITGLTVIEWEKGARPPELINLIAVSRALGVPVGDLLPDADALADLRGKRRERE